MTPTAPFFMDWCGAVCVWAGFDGLADGVSVLCDQCLRKFEVLCAGFGVRPRHPALTSPQNQMV